MTAKALPIIFSIITGGLVAYLTSQGVVEGGTIVGNAAVSGGFVFIFTAIFFM